MSNIPTNLVDVWNSWKFGNIIVIILRLHCLNVLMEDGDSTRLANLVKPLFYHRNFRKLIVYKFFPHLTSGFFKGGRFKKSPEFFEFSWVL
jgi:hypothetical protein